MLHSACFASEKAERISRPVASFDLPDGKLAMVAYMLEGKSKSEEVWRKALHQMRAMGVQVIEIGQISWADSEPQAGQYKWTYAETVLRLNKKERLGFTFVADIGMFINPGLNGKPKLPDHLNKLEFDDPKMISSLANLYRSFFKLEGAENVKYLFQHFENADASFKNREEDRSKVRRLLVESFRAAKEMRPDIKTGVCIQHYGDRQWPKRMIKEWNLDIGTDVVPIISFSPTSFKRSAREELSYVLNNTEGKPIALHETWLHSSEDADSSEEKQQEFLREVFAILRDHHHQIELATWYEYQDLEPFTAGFIGVYLATVCMNPFLAKAFKDRMGSCGLLTCDGKAKPAVKTWYEEAQKYYDFRRTSLLQRSKDNQ